MITIADELIIGATLAGPVLAVQAQKWIERARDKQNRRRALFQTLMATRAQRLSLEHVRALNMIDLEFYGRRVLGIRLQSKGDKEVCRRWNTYRDHLFQPVPTDPADSVQRAWAEKSQTLLSELLVAMSAAVGFDFDEVQIMRGAYMPLAHGTTELSLQQIREQLIQVLEGKRPLPMNVTGFPMDPTVVARQKEIQEKFLEVLDGKRRLPIEESGGAEADGSDLA